MSKPSKTVVAAFVTALAFSASAWAQTSAAGAAPAGAPPMASGPVVKTEPVPHATGGIAKIGQERMEAIQGQYNMHLTFAQGKQGAYLADVKVKIANAKGDTMLETVSGPMLFAKLPAGTYQVSAEVGGQTQTQKVELGGKGAKAVTMRFPG